MKIYVVLCYNREGDKRPCMVLAYKQKRSAEKRAAKARETFRKVETLFTDKSPYYYGI